MDIIRKLGPGLQRNLRSLISKSRLFITSKIFRLSSWNLAHGSGVNLRNRVPNCMMIGVLHLTLYMILYERSSVNSSVRAEITRNLMKSRMSLSLLPLDILSPKLTRIFALQSLNMYQVSNRYTNFEWRNRMIKNLRKSNERKNHLSKPRPLDPV